MLKRYVVCVKKAFKGLRFTALKAGSKVSLVETGMPKKAFFQTSLDGVQWHAYVSGTELTLNSVGDELLFRAAQNNQSLATSEGNRYHFVLSGELSATGKLSSLLSADCSVRAAGPHCFYGLFEGGQALRSVPELDFDEVGEKAFAKSFAGCSFLVNAPDLSADVLGAGCYEGMFEDCVELRNLPRLNAKTLVADCYKNMFKGCEKANLVYVGFEGTLTEAEGSGWLDGCAATGYIVVPDMDKTKISGDANVRPASWIVRTE